MIPTDTPATLSEPDLIVDWLRAATPGYQWTASVCIGAGLSAAALLETARDPTRRRTGDPRLCIAGRRVAIPVRAGSL